MNGFPSAKWLFLRSIWKHILLGRINIFFLNSRVKRRGKNGCRAILIWSSGRRHSIQDAMSSSDYGLIRFSPKFVSLSSSLSVPHETIKMQAHAPINGMTIADVPMKWISLFINTFLWIKKRPNEITLKAKKPFRQRFWFHH